MKRNAHHPVPLAVLNLLALHGYEARAVRHDHKTPCWEIVRISDDAHVDAWIFDSPSMDYIQAMYEVIAEFEGRQP